MPMLTLAQIVSRATELAGGRLDWSLSDGTFYANQAVQYIANAEGIEHRSLESSYATTITSGVSRMVLPADYDQIVTLSIGSTVPSGSTQWRVMTPRDIRWGDTYAGRLDNTTGQPEGYVEYQGRFEVVPSPNSSYSLVMRYKSRITELLVSTTTYPLDEQWNWAVVLKTAELLAMSRNDLQLEQIARNRYLDYMGTLRPDQIKKWQDIRSASVFQGTTPVGVALPPMNRG